MKTLRIVNLNTWVGLLVRGRFTPVPIEPPGHKERRFQAMVAELRERDPDVITLQECLPLPGFARRLAQELGYSCIYRVVNSGLRVFGFGIPGGIGRGEGLAILARPSLRLRLAGARRLSGVGLVSDFFSMQLGPLRAAIAGAVDVGGRRVLVANTHVRYAYPTDDDFDAAWDLLRARGQVGDPPPRLLRAARLHRATRDEELRRLAAWLRSLAARDGGTPVVLGADLNLDPDHPRVRELVSALGLHDALANGAAALPPDVLTWDPDGNDNIGLSTVFTWPDGGLKTAVLQLMAILDAVPQRPDYVMATSDLQVTGAGLAFHEPRDGVFASDHYGVWADVALE